jgi:hypothetical protein
MAQGVLIINARLGLTDDKLVEQIKETPYPRFFIGLEGFLIWKPETELALVRAFLPPRIAHEKPYKRHMH